MDRKKSEVEGTRANFLYRASSNLRKKLECLIEAINSPELNAEIEKETALNELSRWYSSKSKSKTGQKEEKMPKSAVERELQRYEHSDAVMFAAQTRLWAKIKNPVGVAKILKEPGDVPLPTSDSEFGIRAYYRVISEKPDKYILLACHVNVHAFHRGDLRFVQVTKSTMTEGFEEFHVISSLFLGDVVAVTELRRTNQKPLEPVNVFKVHLDSKCEWEVSKMTVLTRKIRHERTFAFLENRTAVLKGHDEVVNVINAPKRMKKDQLFSGSVFFPEKITVRICLEKPDSLKLSIPLAAKCSKIPTYPNAFGTVFSYVFDETATKEFRIGVKAFKMMANQGDVGQGDVESKESNEEKIVETCSLMGYAGANSVFNGRFDCRSFPIREAKINGLVVSFMIPNPSEHPTEKLWTNSTRIEICGTLVSKNMDPRFVRIKGSLETVITDKRHLKMTARISRDSPKDVNFSRSIFLVSQRESIETPSLISEFYQKLAKNSNGYRIIRTLYGGQAFPTPMPEIQSFVFPAETPVCLNKFQNEYVSMVLDRTPMVLANSPFGCGKSMTIVTAALEVFRMTEHLDRNVQLLVTQSNYASVNLVDIMRKCVPHFKNMENKGESYPTFVRYVSEPNWKELPDNCRTEFDYPVLYQKAFVDWAKSGWENLQHRDSRIVVAYVIKNKLVKPDELCRAASSVYKRIEQHIPQIALFPRALFGAFKALYDFDIIMITADSLKGVIGSLSPDEVCSIQVDEASQVPEYTIISLLSSFPDACFGLIGDIHQLPPYCEEVLDGKLKEYGIGNTMERAIQGKMFPRADLNMVYRCHPKITDLLSRLFYDDQLVSGITADLRSEFVSRRWDFWPNSKYPIAIVHNPAKSHRMGTSCGNKVELDIVKTITDEIQREVDGYRVKPEDIGVISFYAGQTALLIEAFRGTEIKCGTVDAFQGSEREVMVLCCTNEKPSEFMQLPNRLNVAMSRARQATIIIGNVDGLRKAKYFREIVKEVEENGCMADETFQPISAGAIKTVKVVNVEKRRRSRRNRRKTVNQKAA